MALKGDQGFELEMYADTSSTVTGGTGVSINAGDPTKFDINVQGIIVDPVTMQNTPVSVNYTALAVDNMAQKVTYIGVDVAGNVLQQAFPLTTEQLYSYLSEYVLIHTDGATINAVNNYPNSSSKVATQVHSLMKNIGIINLGGNVISANGANLKINKSAGRLFKLGAGNLDPVNPNEVVLPAVTPATFRIRMMNGIETGDLTDLDVNNYDVGGVLTPLPNNKFQILRIYLCPAGAIRIQRGQSVHDNLVEGIINALIENYVTEIGIKRDTILIGYLVVKEGATNLSSPTDARFIAANRFG